MLAMADPLPNRPSESPAARHVAYGYVRADEPNEDEIAALRQEIAAYCRTEDLRLVTVFCDRGYDGSELARPGFSALLDALALPESTHLVVPDLYHLSPNDTIRDGLSRQINRTGVTVAVVREPNGALDYTDASDIHVWMPDADEPDVDSS